VREFVAVHFMMLAEFVKTAFIRVETLGHTKYVDYISATQMPPSANDNFAFLNNPWFHQGFLLVSTIVVGYVGFYFRWGRVAPFKSHAFVTGAKKNELINDIFHRASDWSMVSFLLYFFCFALMYFGEGLLLTVISVNVFAVTWLMMQWLARVWVQVNCSSVGWSPEGQEAVGVVEEKKDCMTYFGRCLNCFCMPSFCYVGERQGKHEESTREIELAKTSYAVGGVGVGAANVALYQMMLNP